MKPMWTWSGKFFGYREGDALWTKSGKHVGQFHNKEIYNKDGMYLGEIIGEKLITDKSKSNSKKNEFNPRNTRSFMTSCINYTGTTMRGGYAHFPEPDSFKS